jgi:hypothetical protein
LDDISWLRPTAHFWIRSKQPWVVLPDQPSHVFETQPDDMFAFFNSVVARARGTTAWTETPAVNVKTPARHWSSYGNDPLPTPAEALDEPFSAFPSWFLRITCDR